jgi:hypothetical protein
VFQEFVDSFNGAQKEIDAGFPLEAGIKTKSAIESLTNLDPDSFVGPEGMVLEPLEVILKGFETKQDASSKDEIQLNKAELRREAEMVEYYMNHEKYWIALEVGQELFINRLLYDSGKTENWLDYEVRSNVDLDDRQDDDETSSVNEDVERIWNQICVARNSYAHAGFKKDNPPSESTIKTALGELCNRIDDDEFWRS